MALPERIQDRLTVEQDAPVLEEDELRVGRVRRPIHHLRDPERDVVHAVHGWVEHRRHDPRERHVAVGRDRLLQRDHDAEPRLVGRVLARRVDDELVARDAGQPEFQALHDVGWRVVNVECDDGPPRDSRDSASATVTMAADPVSVDVLKLILKLLGNEGKIQERYGYQKDQARNEIDSWYNRQTW